MLSFLRKNAIYIGGAIVLTFVVTMFSGAVFFGAGFSGGDAAPQQQLNPENQLAMIGSTPVSVAKFAEAQQRIIQQAGQIGPSPEVLEYLNYSAFAEALRFTILYTSAVEADLKVTKQDLTIGLTNIYIQYDIKDKKALKKLLKQNNYPYKSFLATLKKELLAEKFATQLSASVTVSERDVQNAFTEVMVQHILIKHRPEDPAFALNTINDIKAKLDAKEITFGQAAKAHSEDDALKAKNGLLGWIKMGDTQIDFEQAAFALNENQLSEPVETGFGYHLIKVLNRRVKPFPENFNADEFQAQLLTNMRSRRIDNYLDNYLQSNPLTINNPYLSAFRSKNEGNIAGAIGAYQEQISLNPANPAPHYLLAQVYYTTNANREALSELEKAVVKLELNPQVSYPGVYVLQGRVYGRQLETAKKNNSFGKALEAAKGNVALLQQLETQFKQIDEARWATKTKQALDKAQAELEAAQKAAEEAAESTEAPIEDAL